ncbi:MAG: hypothetical protein U0V70_06380 [Terriglobia bacterium]
MSASSLIVCSLVTLATLLLVFRPILASARSGSWTGLEGNPSPLKRLLRKKERVYENIKDLEFEYKMGKLSDNDFHRLREEFSHEAYQLLREIEGLQPETLQNPGEAKVVAVLKNSKKSKR